MRLTADRANSITFTATFDSPQRTTVSSPDAATIALDGVSGNMEGVTGSVRFLALANAVATGGTVSSSGGTLRVSGATSVTAAGVHRLQLRQLPHRQRRLPGHRAQPPQRRPQRRLRPAARPARGRLPGAVRPGDDRPGPHRGGRPDRPTCGSPSTRASNDPQFSALLFQYGRYLLISSSRPGTQPANLQGIWNDQMAPSWDSKYTHQRQPADELLAGRHDEPRRVLPAGLRHDQGPGGHRRPHGPGAVRRRRLGHPPQHRRVARLLGRRRRAVGHVADRRRLAGHDDLGPLPVHRRRRLPAAPTTRR